MNVYAPSISEFNVLATLLDAEEKERRKAILRPSLMIVTEGSGKIGMPRKTLNLEEEYILFIRQGVPLEFLTEEGITVYRAYPSR